MTAELPIEVEPDEVTGGWHKMVIAKWQGECPRCKKERRQCKIYPLRYPYHYWFDDKPAKCRHCYADLEMSLISVEIEQADESVVEDMPADTLAED